MSDDKKDFDVMSELSPHRREKLSEERQTILVKPKKNATGAGDDDHTMPKSASASTGKLASIGGNYKFGIAGGGDTVSATSVRTMPRVYSPLFELSNLQLPRDRRTLNAWCRHFYATHPLVRNCISLHATFPISRFQFSVDDYQILKETEDLAEEMRLTSVLYSTALTYWLLGEAFPYGDWDENNKKWRRWVIHNPDYIDVKYSTVMMEPIITLQPDDTLKRIVRGANARDRYIRATLPKEIIYYISRGMNIPLDNFNVTHLKSLSEPYDHRGTSIIASCFKDLMLYDLLRESEYAQASNMINPLTLVKLGDPLGRWRPSDADIAQFQDLFVDLQFDLDPKIITHGAVSIEKIGNTGTIVDTATKMDRIEKNIFSGLMVPPALVTGEGPNYCYDEETETLTDGGFKRYDEIGPSDKIATYNPDTGDLEYHHYKEKIVSKYTGNMVRFKTHFIDMMVTPNHKMYVQERCDNGEKPWIIKEASQVRLRSKTKAHVNWKGETPKDIRFGGFNFTTDQFISLLLYTWTRSKIVEKDGKELLAFSAPPLGPSVAWRDAMEPLGAVYSKEFRAYLVDSPELKEACLSQMSNSFHSWKIPRLIGDWAVEDIEHAIERIMAVLARHKYVKTVRGGGQLITKAWFSSYDKSLLDNMSELFFKCGYYTRVYSEFKKRTERIIYKMVFSRKSKNREPVIDNHEHDMLERGNRCKSEVPYDGIVYCFDVPPNHLFVTRRNGCVAIQGNSTASVSLEVLRQRYLMFRDEMEYFVRQKVLRPIAEARDWSKMEGGKKVLVIPKVQWNKLNLKDIADYMSKVADAVSKQAASKESLLRVLDMDPEEEYLRRRKEMIEEARLAKEKASLANYTLAELASMDENSTIEDRAPAIPAQPAPGAPPGGMPDLGGGLGGAPELGGGLGGGPEIGAPPAGGEVGAPAGEAPPAGGGGEAPGGAPPV